MNQLTDEQARDFIAFLETGRKRDGSRTDVRANLAELRRAAMNPLSDLRDIRILGDYLPYSSRPTPDDDWVYDAHRLTATLFALYATKFWGRDGQLELPRFGKNDKRRSLGASLRRLRNSLSVGQDSLDLRVSALLDTYRDDLAVPLRGMIQRIATGDKIPIDFARLLQDLIKWHSEETGRVWARDYWQAAVAETDKSETVFETNS
ncbi:hypothetical protein BN8_00528 [Fibrisoma limi BUZ 3]|uniref:CRISPR-associated protein, Cse2 family n=1 Tax=Fibrisoma limi BUZ 3 TaxID=1185876 RepID=I2GCH1_9BACT|nr:type I-E CRISPR-associated protein Cse2/CasB [Fibrisoma limi]CCH51595.1 hypothetical protein BN8_00528 [Fibrisoma limi BUZ 3]